MGIMGVLCLVYLLFAAYQKIVGGSDEGNTDFAKAIFLAVLAPFILCLLGAVFALLSKHAFWICIIAVAFVLLALVVAWIKFVTHKQAVNRFFGETPTSAKRRVEED